MHLDIRLPIGLMFSVLGSILTIYGLLTASETKLLEPSLGININLWWGLFILCFGILMLLFSRLAKPTAPAENESQKAETAATKR